MCTPAAASAAVTAAIARPIDVQSQATSTTLGAASPIHGVCAGQCVPFGPYERITVGAALSAVDARPETPIEAAANAGVCAPTVIAAVGISSAIATKVRRLRRGGSKD